MAPSIPEGFAAAAARCGYSNDELDLFTRHLNELPLHRAARINPLEFAASAGINPEKTVDLFVHCAKLGLFDLEWGMVCPLCGSIVHSVSEISNVAEETMHCCLCNADAESVLDDTIEVYFAYSPAGSALDLHDNFKTYQHYFTSSSYPYREQWLQYTERHTVADVKIQPGGHATLPVSLQAGEAYRLLCLDTHSGAEIKAEEETLSTGRASCAEISLSDTGFSPSRIALAAGGDGTLSLTNQTDLAVWIRVLRIDMDDVMAIVELGPPRFGPRLSGKHLLNNQAFRDCFALNELAPDLKLKLRNLTLLFTDLKGSTALYDREGDLAAYRLVQDHFVALKNVVRDNSGAVIKTMGDAVMAAFPSGKDGTNAALQMMAAMETITGELTGNDVGLKIGLHAGPALAISAGNNLDYFGQTVNIAARVQGLADAGDICLTGALNSDDAIPALLAQAAYDGRPELATLKGVSEQETVYRYRSTV